MTLSLDTIKSIRARTSAPLGDIKKALDDAGGDENKAIELLKQSGAAKAVKKAERSANNGLIETYSHLGKIGVIVEVNCETDFVARNEDFKNFVHDIALQIASMKPENLDELNSQDFIKDPSRNIGQVVTDLTGKIGEKIVIARFVLYELGR